MTDTPNADPLRERYLRVEFGDNDFGWPVRDALKRIWADVYRNNAHLIDPAWRGHDHEFISLSEMFYALHKVGALEPMIARAVDCECHYSDVESATRGLHPQRFPWDDKVVSKSFESITDKYLSTDLSFHAEMLESEADNSEDAWLDLETGKVELR